MIPLVLPALVAGGLPGCSNEEETGFPSSPVAPREPFINAASSNGIDLRWRHNGDGVTGYEVERWTSDLTGDPTVFAIDPSANAFFDPAPDPNLTNIYQVRAVYGATPSQPSTRVRVNLSLGVPTEVGAATEPDSIVISWLPPDFQIFSGFYVSRLIAEGNDVELDDVIEVDHDISTAAEWRDGNAPDGQSLVERLRYLVATRVGTTASAPVVAFPEFQWSYPTLPELVSLDLRAHERAEARFVPGTGHAIVITGAGDGSVELRALESIGGAVPRAISFSVDHPDGEIEGAMPDPSHVVVAHRPAASSVTSYTTYEVPSQNDVRELAVDGGLVGAWNAPEAGAVAVVDGSRCFTLDPVDGDTLTTVSFESSVVAIGFPAEDRIVGVEAGESLDRAPRWRVVARAYPDGASIWTTDWFGGEIPAAGAGLLVSHSGSHLAVSSVASGGLEEIRVFAASNGELEGDAPGRAMTWTSDDTHLIALEIAPDHPRSLGLIGGELVAEDRFGAPNTTGGYVHPASGKLVTTHTVGAFEVWTLTRDWTRSIDATPPPGVDGGYLRDLDAVPRFRLLDLRPGARGGDR